MRPFNGDIIMKAEWKKPQLIVVVRGLAEEKVLDSCKNESPSGPGSVNNWCVIIQDCESDCSALSQS